MKHSEHRVANNILQTLVTFIRILYKVTIFCKFYHLRNWHLFCYFMMMLCVMKQNLQKIFL